MSDSTMTPEYMYTYVTNAYNEPHRKYHTMRHISEMFMLATCCHIDLTLVQRYAILLHDVVYKVPAGEHSNEVCSAETAGYLLREGPLPEHHVEMVKQIILDTEQELPTIHESGLVIDLDLAGLALNYWENLDLIREEFRHLKDEEFFPGRLKWLKSMQARDKIYVSGFFSHLEQAARDNIDKEIRHLTHEGYNHE
jgi:predicted metal-dependent HD superfamily phosphohydrolase